MCVSVKVSADISLQPNTGTKAACVIECVLIVLYILCMSGPLHLGDLCLQFKKCF